MIRQNKFSLAVALAISVTVVGWVHEAWAQAKPPAKPTPEAARETGKLLAQFRAARKDLARQAELVDAAVKAGPACVAALHAEIGRQMYPQLTRYSGRFSPQAAALAKKKIGAVNLDEIVRLRKTVLDLKNQPELTKETIVTVGDPALKKLEALFVVDRAAVLEGSESLRGEREQLQRLGALWERCAVTLYEQLPDDDNKPKEKPSFEKYLQGEEELAAGLAAPMDPRTHEILATNSKLATKLDPEEARAVLALNLTRNLLGLAPVAIDLQLCAAARDHSTDMQTLKFFAHESTVPGKKTPYDRAQRFGTSASAENIAMGIRDGRSVNMGWFHSPGHHKNMLGNHARVGMGLSGIYFTEMFGK